MYLIICRCFFDLSYLNSTIVMKGQQNKELDPAVKQTRLKIQTLFQDIKIMQCQYQEKLNEEEAKIANKIKDFFTSSETIDLKEKYLNGIENFNFTR